MRIMKFFGVEGRADGLTVDGGRVVGGGDLVHARRRLRDRDVILSVVALNQQVSTRDFYRHVAGQQQTGFQGLQPQFPSGSCVAMHDLGS
jgi:hypothetical protein